MVSGPSSSSRTPRTSVIATPPDPFEPLDFVLEAGSELHRVHGSFRPAEFNPGKGSPTRFAHFANPADPSAGIVPTLYAAQTDEAAVCETILHDVPLEGGKIGRAKYRDRTESTIVLRRDVRLAMLMGAGLRRLGTAPQNLTATEGDVYDKTVLWGRAAYAAGFEGVAWMSARENTSEAYMFFGDRVAETDFEVTANGHGPLDHGEPGFRWLSDFCSLVKVDVLLA